MLQCSTTLPRYVLFASSKLSLKNIFISDVPVTTQNPIGMNTKSPPTEQLTAFTTVAGGPPDGSSSPVTTILVAVCVVVGLLLAVSVAVITVLVVLYKRRIHKMSLQVTEMLVIGPIIIISS